MPTVSAQTSSVDWKYFGGVPLGGDMNICFYDAKSVIGVHAPIVDTPGLPADLKELMAAPSSHVRVWTKCLRQKDLNGVNIEKDFGGAIEKGAAQKIAHYYLPPITRVQEVNTDTIITITQYEVTADVADIQPSLSIFYELDCSKRMVGELSIYLKKNGKSSDFGKPVNWQYVPPEGNMADLLKILCPSFGFQG